MPVAVFGIGYVGAVSAACLAHGGHNVVAIDSNPHKVARVTANLSPISFAVQSLPTSQSLWCTDVP